MAARTFQQSIKCQQQQPAAAIAAATPAAVTAAAAALPAGVVSAVAQETCVLAQTHCALPCTCGASVGCSCCNSSIMVFGCCSSQCAVLCCAVLCRCSCRPRSPMPTSSASGWLTCTSSRAMWCTRTTGRPPSSTMCALLGARGCTRWAACFTQSASTLVEHALPGSKANAFQHVLRQGWEISPGVSCI